MPHGARGAGGSGSSGGSGGGSVSHARGPVYNVYAQPISPPAAASGGGGVGLSASNQMPATPAQARAPGQVADLSTERVSSSIRKGGTEAGTTWQYPSPQMFWNALVRKRKADSVSEADMPVVVRIHNEMNERTWRQLLGWEAAHAAEHLPGEPSLRRFMGKPHELTLKARVKAAAGYGLPFDRHDWYVDRGGREVHYVIDYYYDPAPGANVAGEGSGAEHTKSIFVDVRPAVDSLGDALDRLRAFPRRALEALRRPRFVAEGLDPASAPQAAAAFALSAPAAPAPPQRAPPAAADDALFDAAGKKCGPVLDRLRAAPEEERHRAHIAFNYCMASVLCPADAEAYMASLTAPAEGPAAADIEARQHAAFTAMTSCVVARARPPAAAQPAQAALK